MSKYSKIVVIAGMAKDKYTEKNEKNYIVIDIGETLEYCLGYNTNLANAAMTIIRTITTSTTGISISNATYKQGTYTDISNNLFIPLKIYGII